MPSSQALHRSIILLILVSLILAACQPGPASMETPTSTPPASTPTPTLTPPRILTICLGQEPNTLYPYGTPNAAARSVLAAIYDGPIDYETYTYQPVILEKLPSLADGDALIEPVPVIIGDEVVDADGLPATLDEGVRVIPSGCPNDDCAVIYDGFSELEMDQMVVTFTLLPDLVWSDGTPLTAADSVFSYMLAADPDTPGSKYLVDRTQNYEAADELTVQWWGKPGFIDPTYFTNFWTPYPEHLWGEFTAAELPEADVATTFPVGWGPYVIDEWVTGDQITLLKNPYYFRSGEGLPRFNILVFRFINDSSLAISALLAGQCDVLDPSIHLEGQVGLLRALEESNQLQIVSSTTMITERIDFGIQPASYDNGYSLVAGDRPNILGDRRTRQAIAMCLDRQQVVDTVLYGLSPVPDSFIPPDHPLHNPGLPHYPFDVAAASQLLDAVGWKDHDNDASTPRQAWGVPGVLAGTPLVLNYWTTTATQRRQASEILAQSLAQCGIQVDVQYYLPDDLYAEGPAGVLFGRQFDLAQFAMGTAGMEPSCEWYMSAEIPTEKNHWVGTNVGGYNNPVYDAACRAAGRALYGDPEYAEAYYNAQSIFAEDLPSIPLYLHLRLAAARPDQCNFSLDASANPLWNLEAFDYGAACAGP